MLGCSKTAVQRPVPVSAKCSTNLCSRACSQSQASHTELISYSDVTVVHHVTQYCKTPAPKLTQSCKPSEPSPFSLILKPSLTCLLPKSIHLYVPLGGGTAAERGTGEAQAHWLQARSKPGMQQGPQAYAVIPMLPHAVRGKMQCTYLSSTQGKQCLPCCHMSDVLRCI